MSVERLPKLDEPTRSGLGELKGIIAQRYPTATFDVAWGDDPEGVYLRAAVDVEDVDEVLDLVLDRLFHFQVEQGLPVYMLPIQPVERVLQVMQTERPRWQRPGSHRAGGSVLNP